MLQCTQTAMLAAAVGAPAYGRVAGGIKVGPYTLRLVYPASDGHVSITFLFGSMVGPFTQRLMRWVHEEGFCDEATRDLNYVEFFNLMFSGRLDPATMQQATDAVAAFTATRSKAELMAGAVERRLLIAPVTTTADVVASEQLAARDMWDVVDGVRCPGPFARAPAQCRCAVWPARRSSASTSLCSRATGHRRRRDRRRIAPARRRRRIDGSPAGARRPEGRRPELGRRRADGDPGAGRPRRHRRARRIASTASTRSAARAPTWRAPPAASRTPRSGTRSTPASARLQLNLATEAAREVAARPRPLG